MKLAKVLVLAGLLSVAVADLIYHALAMPYSGDEIYNLDTALTFFATGDYTTRHFGGQPFDPVISSGVLATWLSGTVFAAGGSLYAVRLANGFAQLSAVVVLVFVLARRRGLHRLDAAMVATGLWVALLYVASHDQRIINPGELWGAIALGAGALALPRRPLVASFAWGLAAWLTKTIYVPIAAALMLAALIDVQRSGRLPLLSLRLVRAAAALALAFLAPLLAWMALIGLRHDAGTLLEWCVTQIRFVTTHATGLSAGPSEMGGLPGWRFTLEANAASILERNLEAVLRTVVPVLLGPTALVVHTVLRRHGRLRASPTAVRYLLAAGAVVVALAVWFLGFDPTQFERHLLPATYVSVAMAVWCALDLWRSPKIERAWKLAVAAMAAAVVWLAAAHTYQYIASVRGQGSYAKTCRGGDVLEPPCRQDRAHALVAELTGELCGAVPGPFDLDEDCLRRHAAAYVEHAAALAAAADGDPATIDTAAYVALLVQRWGYRDAERFRADLRRLLYMRPEPRLYAYFARAGFDVATLTADCAGAATISDHDERAAGMPRVIPRPNARAA